MTRITELFDKYLTADCSPDEIKELLAHFQLAEDETALKGLILKSLEELDADDDGSQWKQATDKSFEAIKKQMTPAGAKLVPLVTKTWFRVAAAVLILVTGFVLYTTFNTPKKNRDIAETDLNTGEQGNSGSNKAVLTLADGSTIQLQSVANGAVGQQGQTKIVKHTNGELAYQSSNKITSEVLVNRLATPKGGQYQVSLSDGSKVWLNAASSLSFPATFTGNERKVELTGEAYFEIAKNPAIPFKVVVAGKAEIQVLGTHFNVYAYVDEPTINATLLEGKVKIAGLVSQQSEVLSPGEQAAVQSNGQISVNKNADTDQVMAWKNGSFNFNNSDLEMVFRQLSRWYDVDIKFEGPVQKRQFNGEIHRDLQLSQVLKLLEKNNVFCRLEGKTLLVLNK